MKAGLFFFSLLFFAFFSIRLDDSPMDYLAFTFRGSTDTLTERMYPSFEHWTAKGRDEIGLSKFDTASNVLYEGQNYVEIIRQDNKIRPRIGLALGFEFAPEYDSLPYVAQRAVMQYNDFNFGGVRFSERDTFNHTGVVNEFSEDFILTVLKFENDTIEGEFKGVLLNGAGEMTSIEKGHFRVRLFRKQMKD